MKRFALGAALAAVFIGATWTSAGQTYSHLVLHGGYYSYSNATPDSGFTRETQGIAARLITGDPTTGRVKVFRYRHGNKEIGAVDPRSGCSVTVLLRPDDTLKKLRLRHCPKRPPPPTPTPRPTPTPKPTASPTPTPSPSPSPSPTAAA